MSRIGNYIHYRYRNYIAHGTGVTSSGPDKMIDVLEKHQEAMKKFVKPNAAAATIKNDLERQLNFFFGSKESLESMGYTKEQQQQIRSEIENLFKQKIAQLKPNLNLDAIDFNTLSIKTNSLIETIEPIVQTKYGKLNTLSYTYTAAIERRLQKLNEMVNSIDLNDIMSMDIINKIQQLNETYSQLKSEVEAEAKGKSYSGSRKFKTSGEGSLARKTFIDELNLAIVGVKEKYHQQLLGYLGEYIPAITQSVLNSFSLGKISELMGDFESSSRVIGGHEYSTKKILNANNFVGGEFINNSEKNYELDIGNINTKMNYTQDKVDLVLDIPNTDKKIMASVKNYNLNNPANKGIHLHKGASLLKMLQDYPAFTNHYANITASHPAKDDDEPSSIDVSNAHRLMRLTIATYALAGGLLGERKDGTIAYGKKAEILLINDNSKGLFKVYFISDLINKIIQNIDLITIDGYNNPVWDNKWVSNGSTGRKGKSVEAGFRRSMKVIAQMHKTKISVSIDLKAFT